MDITREQFDNHPSIKDLPESDKTYLRREFFKDMVSPKIKGRSREDKAVAISEWGIVAPDQKIGRKEDMAASAISGIASSLPVQAGFAITNPVRKMLGQQPFNPGDLSYEPQTTAGHAAKIGSNIASEMIVPGGAAVKGVKGGLIIAKTAASAGLAGLLQGGARSALESVNKGQTPTLSGVLKQAALEGGLSAVGGAALAKGANIIGTKFGKHVAPPPNEFNIDAPVVQSPPIQSAAPTAASRVANLTDAGLLNIREKAMKSYKESGNQGALGLMQTIDNELTRRGSVDATPYTNARSFAKPYGDAPTPRQEHLALNPASTHPIGMSDAEILAARQNLAGNVTPPSVIQAGQMSPSTIREGADRMMAQQAGAPLQIEAPRPIPVRPMNKAEINAARKNIVTNPVPSKPVPEPSVIQAGPYSPSTLKTEADRVMAQQAGGPRMLPEAQLPDSATTRQGYLDTLYRAHETTRKQLDVINSKLMLANKNPMSGPKVNTKGIVKLQGLADDYQARLAKLEQEMMYLEGSSTPPRPTTGGGNLSEMNAGVTPKNIANALGQIRDQKILERGAGVVTDVAARGLSKLTGKKFEGGYEKTGGGYDRLGRQFSNWYDAVKYTKNTGNETIDKVLKVVREGMGEDYGLDPKYIQTRLNWDDKSRGMSNMANDLQEKLKNELTPEQNVELYHILNDPAATNTILKEVSEPLRQLIKESSKRMVDVGALGEKAFSANEGQYLKRLYEKHIHTAPTITKWITSFNRGIKGSKGRGKTRTVGAKAFEEFNQKWDVVDDNGTVATVTNGAITKQVPSKHAGDYAGDWKKLGTNKDGSVRAWRDYTYDERTAMGERRVGSDSLAATLKQIARDLHRGEFLSEISKNPEWSISDAAIKEGAEIPAGWKYLGNDPGYGGIKKWGHLADHYIESRIYRDLVRADFETSNQYFIGWKKILGEVKKNFTTRNPMSHLYNWGQNAVMLELNGGSMMDYNKALNIIRAEGDDFKSFRDAGLFDNSFIAHELAAHVDPNSVASFIGGASDFLTGVGKLDAGKTLKGLGRIDQRATDLYQSSDDIFRAALVIGKMRDGLSLNDAAKFARQKMYNPKTTAPWVKNARDSGALMFARVPHWMFAEMPKIIAENPGKAAMLVAMWKGYNFITNAINDTSEKDVRTRERLVNETNPGMSGQFGFAPLPFKDTQGNDILLKTKNYSPVNFLEVNDRTAVPGLSAIQPGGPILAVGNALAGNTDAFTGKKIRNPAEPWSVQMADTGKYLFNQVGPAGLVRTAEPLLAGGKDLINRAIGTKFPTTTSAGRRYDVVSAIPGALGAQSFDRSKSEQKMMKKYSAQINDAKRVVSDARKDLREGRNEMTQDKLKDVIKSQRDIIRGIQKKRDDSINETR